jgi:hypothetical protein
MQRLTQQKLSNFLCHELYRCNSVAAGAVCNVSILLAAVHRMCQKIWGCNILPVYVPRFTLINLMNSGTAVAFILNVFVVELLIILILSWSFSGIKDMSGNPLKQELSIYSSLNPSGEVEIRQQYFEKLYQEFLACMSPFFYFRTVTGVVSSQSW